MAPFGPLHASPTFTLGGQHFSVDDWEVWHSSQGHTVYRSTSTYGDGGYRYIWATHYNGAEVLNQTALLFQANAFLANPAAWEAADNARRHDAELGSTLGGSISHAISHVGGALSNVVSSVTDVTAGIVGTGIQLDEALFHPVTVTGNGLQLSSDAIELVPGSLQGIAQTATSALGYLTVGAAAATAIAGAGGLSEIASGVADVAVDVGGAVGTVAGVVSDGVGLVSGVLGAGQAVLGAVNALNGGAAPMQANAQPAQLPLVMALPEISPFLLLGLAAVWLLSHRK